MDNNPHEKALNSMFNDLDDMEGNKMFGSPDAGNGFSITISVTPDGASEADHEEGMCKGGCAYHSGGVVQPEAEEEAVDLDLPPFLRKKKKV